MRSCQETLPTTPRCAPSCRRSRHNTARRNGFGLCYVTSVVMWSWRSRAPLFLRGHCRCTPHKGLQPTKPADEFGSFDEKTSATWRCKDLGEYLQERLPLELIVSTRITHRCVQVRVTEPLADGDEVDSGPE